MIKLIQSVLAAEPNIVDIKKIVDAPDATTGKPFFGFTCIWNLVSNVASTALILGVIIFFVFLVMGGIEWSLSGGDKAKVEAAQKRITNALIGLTILAASWAIYVLVLNFFGINLESICPAKG